jgi:hypothetical protein
MNIAMTTQVADIEAAEKQKMREKVQKIIAHGINYFVNRQLIYNFPEELFADAGILAIEHADFEGIERLALVTGCCSSKACPGLHATQQHAAHATLHPTTLLLATLTLQAMLHLKSDIIFEYRRKLKEEKKESTTPTRFRPRVKFHVKWTMICSLLSSGKRRKNGTEGDIRERWTIDTDASQGKSRENGGEVMAVTSGGTADDIMSRGYEELDGGGRRDPR